MPEPETRQPVPVDDLPGATAIVQEPGDAPEAEPEPEPWTGARVNEWNAYYDVYVTWRNAWVNLIVNRDTKRGGPNNSLAAPVLSADQLVGIAINPDLTVTS